MNTLEFVEFRKTKLAEGNDEVLVREWEPNFQNTPHEHPFDTDATVVRGEFWLVMNGAEQHLKPGDNFKVPRGVQHFERYGAEGATFWAARKN
jgi:quercetin dioxygenase-like cupin family protein